MKGFLHFLRTQGVVALAIAFIIGGAAQDFVKSISAGFLTPLVGVVGGKVNDLQNASSTLAGVSFGWGGIVFSFINLLLIALLIYLIVKSFGFDKLDEKKDM